ncbi:hypothetical protein cypCar_00015318 [Cyprinus carpio]|nr:hypothetical protein cypCar_00015318 [Cyprinus carpio]
MWTTLMKLDLVSVGIAVSLGLIFVVLFEIFRINSYRAQTPPGPRPLPFVGTIPYFLKNPMEFIRSLSQYGEMATVYLGRKPAIILNTIQLAKEALVQNASSFSGRPHIPLIIWITDGFGIILVTFGHSWRQQRRFALHTLRNFGLGKKSVEERVTEESNYLVLEMLKSEGPHQKIYQNAEELKAFIREAVKTHRETLDPDSPRDFIDAYLLEIEKQKSNEDSTFHEDNMLSCTSRLILKNVLISFCFITERCHEEIVQVLGYDCLPSMDDRDKLPYTYATVHEIQRCANIVPSGVIHETTQPTKLRGYDIPKGTEILTNFTAILTDKEHWKYPDTFNPENFLDDNGHFFKPESFLPFSLGPRVCLGEILAKTELFLFITSLLQRISFSWPPGVEWPDMNGIVGIVRSPEPFDIICHSRGS